MIINRKTSMTQTASNPNKFSVRSSSCIIKFKFMINQIHNEFQSVFQTVTHCFSLFFSKNFQSELKLIVIYERESGVLI